MKCGTHAWFYVVTSPRGFTVLLSWKPEKVYRNITMISQSCKRESTFKLFYIIKNVKLQLEGPISRILKDLEHSIKDFSPNVFGFDLGKDESPTLTFQNNTVDYVLTVQSDLIEWALRRIPVRNRRVRKSPLTSSK